MTRYREVLHLRDSASMMLFLEAPCRKEAFSVSKARILSSSSPCMSIVLFT